MWRLLLLLPLAACSGAASGPCRLQPVADLPVTLDGNRLETMAKVDGADTTLLLDTGAEQTVLTAATAAALHLPRSQHSASRLAGVGGVVTNADVYADLDLGGVGVRRRLAVADIPGLGGLVGADVLGDYDLELDLPGRRVRLWRAPGCGAADLPWTGPRVTVPVDVTGGGLLRVGALLDGLAVPALLDSGASRSVVQADAAGVTPGALAADPASVSRGVDGGAIAVRAHRFRTLAVGRDSVAGPRIGVAAFNLRGAAMLIGVDYLRTRRVWVAYRTGQLFIQDATGR